MNGESFPVSIPVLARLRAETRAEHDAIETVLDLVSGTLTLGTYRQTLARFHGFYRPLEVGVQAVGGWAARGLDLAGRWKTPLLEADLQALAASTITPGDRNEIVSAAKDTFSKRHRWTTAGGDDR